MVDVVSEEKQVLFGDDSIVIRQFISGIEGGRALDVTDFTTATGTSIVKSGTFIIRDDNGNYKPAPVTKNSEGEVSYGETFSASAVVGILVATIDAKKDGAGIMTAGRVNKAVLPYGGSAKAAAVAEVLTHIEFMEDGE